jgi:hypothetical protein
VIPSAVARVGQQAIRAVQLVPVAVEVAVAVDVVVLVAVTVEVVLLSPQVPVVQFADELVDPVGSQLGSIETGWPPVHATVIELRLASVVPVAMVCPEPFLIVRLTVVAVADAAAISIV